MDSIEVVIVSNGFDDDIDRLNLRELYLNHKAEAQDILVKKHIYDNSAYLQELNVNFGIRTGNTVYQMFDIPESPEEFGKKPLSKFRYDIWNYEEKP